MICPCCGWAFAGTEVRRVRRGSVVDCRECGPVPWRAVLPQSAPMIIDQAALAAHRASGESQQRRRWHEQARRRWLSGRNAPQLHEC